MEEFIESTTANELAHELADANIAYRKGSPTMSDAEWDRKLDELRDTQSDHPYLMEIGYIDHKSERKQELPFLMASMNKIKTIEEYKDWLRKKEISSDTVMIITGKYDGISLTVNETFKGGKAKDAWTRGDGKFGEYIPEHFAKVEGARMNMDIDNMFSFGELIISRKNFKKYDKMIIGEDEGYANGRNMVGGLANNQTSIPNALRDCDYIRYGIHNTSNYDSLNKDHQLESLNRINKTPIPFKKINAGEITIELLQELFGAWNSDYEMDGLIIEINNYDLRKKLGREKNNNPVYARAFKGEDWEQVEETVCTGETYQVSKKGHLSPVAHIIPVKLDGAVVSNINCDNAKWMMIYGIGEGTILTVKRSGMVIPRIVSVSGTRVVSAKEFNKIVGKVDMNTITSSEIGRIRKDLGLNMFLAKDHPDRFIDNFEYPDHDGWDGVHLKAKGEEDTVQQQRMVAFFEILKIEGISDSTVEDLFERGYTTIKQILELTPQDMNLWEGWGERKAEIFHKNIHGGKLQNVPIEKAQHASGFFFGLGSKKLALVKHFTKKPTIAELVAVEGFSDTSAEIYIKGLEDFWGWIAELPITLKMKEDKRTEPISSLLDGWAMVFTGFRNKELEEKIVLNGGEIKSGISGNSTHLVMKEKGSGTTKEQKALKLGQTIYDEAELIMILEKIEKTGKL